MNLTILSISYENAPIECLEKVTSNKDEVTHYLNTLMGGPFFNEMVVISTCNRAEWVFTSPEPIKARSVLIDCIQSKSNISATILDNMAVTYQGNNALIHLFELAAGLKSMVLGENEILAQIKSSYSFCMEFGSTSGFLNKVFQMVIATGKDIRSKTNMSKGAHSISSIAIEAVKLEKPDFLNAPMLLIGAGVMIHRAIAKCTSMGHKSLSIANRSMSRAEALAESFDNINVIPYASVRKKIHEFSIIYVAISSKNYLIRYDDLKFLSKPMILVDLGIPRNIDPSCKLLSNVNVVSIAELQTVSNQTISNRTEEIPIVKQMIQEAINELKRWESYRNQTSEPWVKKIQYG